MSKHFYVSLIKSIARLIACGIFMAFAPNLGLLVGSILFMIAEILGIVEELFE